MSSLPHMHVLASCPPAAFCTCRALLLHPHLSAFCSSGSGSGGITAKDALGNDVKASEWIKKYGANSRSLTQGLKVRILQGRQAEQAWGVHLSQNSLFEDTQMDHRDGGEAQYP